MLSRRCIFLSLAIVVMALYLQVYNFNRAQPSTESIIHHEEHSNRPSTLIETETITKRNEHAVYVIGDLHGDVYCARHWIERTGLIRREDEEQHWTDPTSRLVFMGDYLDKGIFGRQTVELVKSLQEKFPQYVTALMGNHEIELLQDRNPLHKPWGNGTAKFFQLIYATVHPAEYLNYVQNVDEKDEIVIQALYNASLEVYGKGKFESVFMIPDKTSNESIVQFVRSDLVDLVQERLAQYQHDYIKAFASGTELGTWLEQRPVLALLNDTIFVHGGISPEASRTIASLGVDRINQLMAEYTMQDKLDAFLYDTEIGQDIYEMLVYRGNHEPGACAQLPSLLAPLGATRLGVGHTPTDNVRVLCRGQFLSLDSALGRWLRLAGNNYCRGDKEQTSSNGQAWCGKLSETCQGQIVRIRNGKVEIIETDP